MVFAFNFINLKKTEGGTTDNTEIIITSASLRASGHERFDYHNYQVNNNYFNTTYLDIRLKYNFYYVDSNGIPTDDTNGTKVYYTGMYQLTPNNGWDQHQHTMIDKNDTNIRTIKIPEMDTNLYFRVHILEGDGNVYINDNSIHSNIQNTSVSLSNINHNDILKIEYSHSENGSVVVSDTVEFKILLQDFTEYIPRDLIETNNNGNVITRSTQPIWYVRDNVIIINLEKLVGHTYMFNNPDSHSGYVPVFPHNYRPNNSGYFPEIAIPYSSGMKVKWLGLTNAVTPNSSNSGEASIYRAGYHEEITGMFDIVTEAGWYHTGHYLIAGTEYDISDGDPNGGDTYSGTYITMENNQDVAYKTAINIYFHKVLEIQNYISTEQFYDITNNQIDIKPWEVENNQVRFRFNSGTENHYADIGGTYYVYVPTNVNSSNFSSNYPNNDSLLIRNKSRSNSSMFGSKIRGTHWDVGDTIELYSFPGEEIVFHLVLTDDYSYGWQASGIPPPPVYTENILGGNGFGGDEDRHEMRVYNDDATTMTFMGGVIDPILNRGEHYYLYIPSEINEIRMNYPYWVKNTTKNIWWNTGANNYSASGINNRGTEWSIGDMLSIDNNSTQANPVYLTITDQPPPN